MEIERLKKELKQSKKSVPAIESPVNVPTETAPPLQPVTADTSALMDELMAGTRRNNKKQHVTHSNSRESQVSGVRFVSWPRYC